MRPLLLLAPLVGSCGILAPVLPPLVDTLQAVPVQITFEIQVEGALLPTDVTPRQAGGIGVLDGYGQRAVLYTADGAPDGTVPIPGGHTVRISPAHDGPSWWVAAPSQGAVLELNPEVDTLRSVPIDLPDMTGEAPVAVYDTGQSLVVGLRTGQLVWVDPADGAIQRVAALDTDSDRLGAIADIVPIGDGALAVIDALGPRIHIFEADGTPRTWFGHRGNWVGYLSKPKSAAPGPDGTLIVADSALGVLQLFDADGAPLGVLTQQGEPLRFEHLMAIEPLGDGRTYLALDGGTATVFFLVIDDATVKQARLGAEVRHLRHPLVQPDASATQRERQLCLQCHDGVVNDDRQVWDGSLGHHPLDVKPEGAPAIFPLEDDGTMSCRTCHSPHGAVALELAKSSDTEASAALVRKQVDEGLFTRLARSDAELCLGCHEDAAHEGALDMLGLEGGSHPAGADLVRALEERGEGESVAGLPAGVGDGCLACHTPHAAQGEHLVREADGAVCMACHQDQHGPGHHALEGAQPGTRFALRAESALPLGPHGASCTTCHDPVGGGSLALLRSPEDGGDLCASCHPASHIDGQHARLSGPAGMGCLRCHDVHGDAGADHLLIGKTCVDCHSDVPLAAQASQWKSVGHPMAEGASCRDCHTNPHKPATSAGACTDCHDEHQAAVARGGHGGASCASCHTPHGPLPRLAQADLHPVEQECLACHGVGRSGSTKAIEHFRHPTPVFGEGEVRWDALAGLPLYTQSGAQAREHDGGDLVCQSCHLVHGPSKTKADNLRREGWKQACSACHGRDALTFYRYFHTPARRGTP